MRPKTKRSMQFSLRGLLLFMTAFAVALSILVPLGRWLIERAPGEVWIRWIFPGQFVFDGLLLGTVMTFKLKHDYQKRKRASDCEADFFGAWLGAALVFSMGTEFLIFGFEGFGDWWWCMIPLLLVFWSLWIPIRNAVRWMTRKV